MSKEEFAELYAPSKQYTYSLHEARCHNGSAPTLRDIVKQYGADFCLAWVQTLVDDLQTYTAAKQRLNDVQKASLSAIIVSQYGRLKAPEMLLFLVKAKAGQFGKFYNTIDPMDISTAVAAWCKECDRIKADALYQQEQDRREHERTERAGECITLDEAMRRGIVKNPLLRRLFGG